MEGAFLIIIFVFVVLAILAQAHRRARVRSAQLSGWATARGFYFHPGKIRSFDDEHPVLRCLRKGNERYAYNVASGEWGNVVFTSFDYHSSTGSGKNKRIRRFSGMLLRPQHTLKPLIVRPEGFFDRMKAGFGMNDIDFESAEFSKKFYVSALAKNWAYDVIHPRTMEFLMLNNLSPQKFSFECDHEVLCVVSKDVLEISGFEAAHHFGTTILDAIPDYVREKL